MGGPLGRLLALIFTDSCAVPLALSSASLSSYVTVDFTGSAASTGILCRARDAAPALCPCWRAPSTVTGAVLRGVGVAVPSRGQRLWRRVPVHRSSSAHSAAPGGARLPSGQPCPRELAPRRACRVAACASDACPVSSGQPDRVASVSRLLAAPRPRGRVWPGA